jgi:hypothetical protein
MNSPPKYVNYLIKSSVVLEKDTLSRLYIKEKLIQKTGI